MDFIDKITQKSKRLVIGLMSGTCTDGIDAALVEIEGSYTNTKANLKEFITIPYNDDFRTHLLKIAKGDFGGSSEICKMNFLLGKLSAIACEELCKKANVSFEEIDLIGSHGHTVFHQPQEEIYFDYPIISTLQIGEASVISEHIGCPVVSDFRVRDIAAGGLGAPLVPYTEYLLYSKVGKNIALQNIGGISNITYLPSDCDINKILAFDTGVGNMVIDALVSLYSNNKMHYDKGGEIAKNANVNTKLLDILLDDEYIYKAPPKTTGREYYGEDYVKKLVNTANSEKISIEDTIATATMFTAKSIAININKFLPAMPEKLIIGGGGSMNKTLLTFIKELLPNCKVMTNEDMGLDSNAKEAVAFAVLANETIFNRYNNIPTATGARHSVVMGKITL